MDFERIEPLIDSKNNDSNLERLLQHEQSSKNRDVDPGKKKKKKKKKHATTNTHTERQKHGFVATSGSGTLGRDRRGLTPLQ
jgi:hypothetical protein